jgi:arylsulfatase A-like enzyme
VVVVNHQPTFARSPGAAAARAVAVVLALLGATAAWPALAAAPPHVVVILVDDMGYGDPGSYNPASRIPTPHIDRLAAEGMRFTDAHAPGPLCHPSRYGLMTGRYPFRTDVSQWPTRPLIEDAQVTLPSMLRSAGYATAMVGKWHLGFTLDGYEEPLRGGPVDRGFDSFFGIRASTDIPPYFYIRGDRAVTPPTGRTEGSQSAGWSPIQGAFWRAGGIAPDLKLSDVLPRLTDEAIAVIEKRRGAGKPLMLYLAYPAPHTPWLPSPAFAGKSGAGLYGDFLMMVDHEIGRVLAALASAEMLDKTLLMFTSDNGPVWYPSDTARFGHDSTRGLRGMKGDAWEAGHRMPFIVRWPGLVGAGSVCDQTISFTDVLATVADVVGKNLPAGAGPDSFSFLPALKGGTLRRPPIVMQSGGGFMTIRSGRWKLIEGLGSGGFSEPARITAGPGDAPGQLYDLAVDPAETTNRFAGEPEVVGRLRAEMRSIVEAGRSR